MSQVSSSQLGNLARLAAGTKLVAQSPSNGAGNNGAGAPAEAEAGPGLDLEDFRSEIVVSHASERSLSPVILLFPVLAPATVFLPLPLLLSLL